MNNQNPSIQCTRLSGGVMVVTEYMSHVSSVSLGVWSGIGSRDESPKQNGLAHFYEHMAFKGTENCNALELVQKFEATGGHVNAYTTKEYTCFYGKVVADEAVKALDTLLEMTLKPVLEAGEFKKEKEVILEEIRGCNDNPDERVYDLLGSALFGEHPLGRPIAGTLASVKKMTLLDLKAHLHNIQYNKPLCISAVGQVNHDKVVAQVKSWMTAHKLLTSKTRFLRDRKSIPFRLKHIHESKELEQATVVLAFPAFPIHDPKCYALSLLNVLMGDGMSSRLFQEVREKLGLVYQISSYTEFLAGAGFLAVSFSADSIHTGRAVSVIGKLIKQMASEGISAEELDFAKKYVRGNFLLEMESPQSRAAFLARAALFERRIYTPEKYLKGFDKWKLPAFNSLVKAVLRPQKWGSCAIVPKGTQYRPQQWFEKN